MEKASGFTNRRTVTEIAGLALHYLTTVVRIEFQLDELVNLGRPRQWPPYHVPRSRPPVRRQVALDRADSAASLVFVRGRGRNGVCVRAYSSGVG